MTLMRITLGNGRALHESAGFATGFMKQRPITGEAGAKAIVTSDEDDEEHGLMRENVFRCGTVSTPLRSANHFFFIYLFMHS